LRRRLTAGWIADDKADKALAGSLVHRVTDKFQKRPESEPKGTTYVGKGFIWERTRNVERTAKVGGIPKRVIEAIN
jgi:hypothetical protein